MNPEELKRMFNDIMESVLRQIRVRPTNRAVYLNGLLDGLYLGFLQVFPAQNDDLYKILVELREEYSQMSHVELIDSIP